MKSVCTLVLPGLIVIATLLPGHARAEAMGPRVHTESGEIEGSSRNGVEAYLGVPYARAPVGDLRWRPPAAPAAWPGVHQAHGFGAACMQDSPHPWGPFTNEFVDLRAPMSEDCLFLNVWAPQGAGKKDLPVLVWFHGGGFGSGAASVPIYDGSHLAKRGVIVVSINYRLGIFGFLAHPELRAESSTGVSGNYGLLDMIAALRWVQTHAQRFGGRPDRVTIAGQSAGAAAVLDLLASPLAQGLFSRAIALSGAGMGVRAQSLDGAEREGAALLDQAGIRSLAALRELTAEKVQAIKPAPDKTGAMPRLLYAPVVDGRVLPVDVESTPARLASAVPVLTGYTADEGFVMGAPPATSASFEAYVRQRYGALSERFLALYPHATDEQATASLRLIARDRYMAALVVWAQRRARTGQDVYGYLFKQVVPGPDAQRFGAFHTGELPYLFGVLDRGLRPYTAADEAVAQAMQRHWLSFVAGASPDPAWPRLQPDQVDVMEIGERIGTVPAVSSKERLQAFIDHVAAGGQLSLF